MAKRKVKAFLAISNTLKRTSYHSINPDGSRSKCSSKRDSHDIACAKRAIAIGTLSRPRCSAFFHAFLTEDVTACLDGCIFEVDPADGADGKLLV